MKRIACALLLLSCLLPLQADSSEFIANSTFADGRAHWKGDPQEPDAALGSVDVSSNGSSGSVVINLKKDKWTKIYQIVTVRAKHLDYTVKFVLSDDYKLSAKSGDDMSQADFGDVPGINWTWSLAENEWALILSGGSWGQKYLTPDTTKGKEQTLSGRMSGDLTQGQEAVFLIAFPPGQGSITFHQISLKNGDGGSDQ